MAGSGHLIQNKWIMAMTGRGFFGVVARRALLISAGNRNSGLLASGFADACQTVGAPHWHTRKLINPLPSLKDGAFRAVRPFDLATHYRVVPVRLLPDPMIRFCVIPTGPPWPAALEVPLNEKSKHDGE